MEFFIDLLILIILVAILFTLRDILHYTRLTVFKLATKEPVPSTSNFEFWISVCSFVNFPRDLARSSQRRAFAPQTARHLLHYTSHGRKL